MLINALIFGAIIGLLLGLIQFFPLFRLYFVAMLTLILGVIATAALSEYTSPRSAAVIVMVVFLFGVGGAVAFIAKKLKIDSPEISSPSLKGIIVGILFLVFVELYVIVAETPRLFRIFQ